MIVDVTQLAFWVVIGIAGIIILYHIWCFISCSTSLCMSSDGCYTKNNRKTIVRLVEPSSSCGSHSGCNGKKKKCCPKPCFYTVPPPPPPPPPSSAEDEDNVCYVPPTRCHCCCRQSKFC